jgi:hypothetical protein
VVEEELGVDGMIKPLEAASKPAKQATRRTVILFSVKINSIQLEKY